MPVYAYTVYAQPVSGGGGGSSLIPSSALYSGWSTAGVTGGIPAQTQTIFTTITTTGADQTAQINTAITSCPAGQVVKLGAGTFLCSGVININNQTGKVLRGSGVNSTTLDCRSNPGINLGNGNSDWPWPNTGTALTVAGAVGDFTLTFASTTAFTVGDRVRIYLDDDQTLPVLTVNGFDVSRYFTTKVVSKTSTTVTFKDSLPYALPLALNPGVHIIADGFSYQCGIEDLRVDCSNASITFGIRMWSVDECWMQNVTCSHAANYDFYFLNATHCEVRRCFADTTLNPGNNGSGFLIERTSLCLVEDNIIWKAFPHFEINFGCSGNVIAYNFCQNNGVGGVTQGGSIDANHGAHNSFNLFEGNVSPQFTADGYYGSSSNDVIFRNRLHGSNAEGSGADRYDASHCAELNRFTRNYVMVENVMGATQAWFTSVGGGTLIYDALETSNEPAIWFLGYPNLGNNSFTGTAQLSIGDTWADIGTFPGPTGFQELDRDVALSLTRKRNYNSVTGGIHSNETYSSTEPNSLFRSSKPSWFNSLGWPAYGTGGNTAFDIAASFQLIPAGYRYFNGGADPP